MAILAAGCASAPEATEGPAVRTPTPYGEQLPMVGAVASSQMAWGPEGAIDGANRTRWRAVGNEVEWIYVDLGESYHITRVAFHWYSGFDSGEI